MDFIKYFQHLRKTPGDSTDPTGTQTKGKAPSTIPPQIRDLGEGLVGAVKQTAHMLAAYRSIPAPDQQRSVIKLYSIKRAVEQPKTEQPDARFATIQANLSEAECYQTIREERWNDAVYCPYCFATKIERLPPSTQCSAYNFRYLCLACNSRFNDDSRTPFETKIHLIEIWMQCWFLLGCTNSIDYIAAKLNLDLDQVKFMISELKQAFNANQPLTKLMSYELWHQAHADKISSRIQNEILGKQELLQGETTKIPQDTAMVRRNKERRLRGSTSTHKF